MDNYKQSGRVPRRSGADPQGNGRLLGTAGTQFPLVSCVFWPSVVSGCFYYTCGNVGADLYNDEPVFQIG